MRLSLSSIALLIAGIAHAELSVQIEDTILPRSADFSVLPVTLSIDDVLPSDYEQQEGEEDVWDRLHLTLPDSDDAELPLHNAADLPDSTGFNRHFWYEAKSREQRRNDSGNLTVTWHFVLKARGKHQLSDLMQGTPPALQLAVSYHHWQGNEYSEALLDHTHAFPRLDGVPAEAPQQAKLTPRHHRLHIDWHVPESVAYSNAQGEFPPAGVVAIVAAASEEAIDITKAAMLFRPAAEGGDVPLSTGQCLLMSDCQITCGNDENIYFDFEKIKTINALQNSKLLQDGTGVINDLQPGITYRVLLQYYPDGLQRSACLTAVPVENKTMLELNGAEAAKREDLRCFIATAVWGKSRAVAELRWWRDNFLLTHRWGRALVAFYYQHAPPLADLLAEHTLLRALLRIMLLVPLAVVLMCKYPLLLVALLLCAYIYVRHHRQRQLA